jgi:hypothetical protein
MDRNREALGPIDQQRRYPIPIAAAYLCISRTKLYNDITAGLIATIKDGGRRFIPGSEIVRRSTLPSKAA